MENRDKIIDYWRVLADEKWDTVLALMEKKRYADALFFGHLSLEAELKAAVVSATGEHAPYIHDLEKLATLALLPLSAEQRAELAEVSTFNIAGRYDNDKFVFHKKVNDAFARGHVNQIEELRLWIKRSTQVEK